MQDLYSPEIFSATRKKLRNRLGLLALVGAACLAVFIWAMVNRNEWPAIVSLSLFCFFTIFFVDLFCLPVARYKALVSSALTGRTHTAVMTFVRIEPDLSMIDGVPCRGLIFLGEPDKHGTREQLYYWDNALPLPELVPDTDVEIRYTGKNIIALGSENPASRP